MRKFVPRWGSKVVASFVISKLKIEVYHGKLRGNPTAVASYKNCGKVANL